MVAALCGFPARPRLRPHAGPAPRRRYERRRPEKTALHKIISENLASWLELSQPNLCLAELPDDLLRSELLSSWHLLTSLGLLHPQILSLEAVPFNGGRSVRVVAFARTKRGARTLRNAVSASRRCIDEKTGLPDAA